MNCIPRRRLEVSKHGRPVALSACLSVSGGLAQANCCYELNRVCWNSRFARNKSTIIALMPQDQLLRTDRLPCSALSLASLRSNWKGVNSTKYGAPQLSRACRRLVTRRRSLAVLKQALAESSRLLGLALLACMVSKKGALGPWRQEVTIQDCSCWPGCVPVR